MEIPAGYRYSRGRGGTVDKRGRSRVSFTGRSRGIHETLSISIPGSQQARFAAEMGSPSPRWFERPVDRSRACFARLNYRRHFSINRTISFCSATNSWCWRTRRAKSAMKPFRCGFLSRRASPAWEAMGAASCPSIWDRRSPTPMTALPSRFRRQLTWSFGLGIE